jgi:peptidoglycan/xylan/chitin deacetylase (PgdA/CDA1 family)
MYHRFEDAQRLAVQCRHLRELYQPLSLTEAADCLHAGALPENAVAVTVDDGYRDVLEVAHPVFAAHGIPFLVYLVTDFLDGRLWLWLDQARYALQNTRQPRLRMTLPEVGVLDLALDSDEQRRVAARRLCESLKLLRHEDRCAALACLPEILDIEIPDEPPRDCAPLRWDEVRAMVEKGVEFGAHTRTHLDLSPGTSPVELAEEVVGSKRRIEEMLQAPVLHFCYPNGKFRDISANAVDAVREAGYRSAVTAEGGLNFPGDDVLRLRRIGVETGYEEDFFQRCVAAFRV